MADIGAGAQYLCALDTRDLTRQFNHADNWTVGVVRMFPNDGWSRMTGAGLDGGPQDCLLWGRWLGSADLDRAITEGVSPFLELHRPFRVVVAKDTSLRISAIVRLLLLLNLLVARGRPVELDFGDKPSGLMGYIERMGFFELLSEDVRVSPCRPNADVAAVYKGNNPSLVEIVQIHPSIRDEALPSKVAAVLAHSYQDDETGSYVKDAVWTALTELIGNVYQHAASSIGGFAALQTYHSTRTVEFAVSDAGPGILSTLRPAKGSPGTEISGAAG